VAEPRRQAGCAATISLRACSCAAGGGAGAARPLQTSLGLTMTAPESGAFALWEPLGMLLGKTGSSSSFAPAAGSRSALDSAPLSLVDLGEQKLEALLSACAVPQSPFFSEASPASLRTAAASYALRTPVDTFVQVALEGHHHHLADLRSPASGSGVALSRCDASEQLPSMLDFGSPAALFSTSPAQALLSPMIFPPGDTDKFSAKVTVAASLSPGVSTFIEPSPPLMLSPCGQLLGTPCGGWDYQAEKLEWGAQWAAEDKLVTFAPGTVEGGGGSPSIQRAVEKIGSPALIHLNQACEFCEGNEAELHCKGADDGMGDLSEISDSEGEGHSARENEVDPASVAPPEKPSEYLKTISAPLKALSDSSSSSSSSTTTTTTSSKSSSKSRWKMKTTGIKAGHGRKWCEKCSAVHHYKRSCWKCAGEVDGKVTATSPLPPPSAAATSELRRKRAREGEKVTAFPATSELRQSMHALTVTTCE
jgi:hypothetical protein